MEELEQEHYDFLNWNKDKIEDLPVRTSLSSTFEQDLIKDIRKYRDQIDSLSDAALGALSSHKVPDYENPMKERKFSGDPDKALRHIARDLGSLLNDYDRINKAAQQILTNSNENDVIYNSISSQIAERLYELKDLQEDWIEAVSTCPEIERKID